MRTTRVVKHLAIFAVLLAGATAALAQQARVHGTVIDSSGQPVAGAKLVLDPIESSGVRVTVTTNKKGAFLIGLVRPGLYRPSVEVGGKAIRHLKAKAVDLDRRVVLDLDGDVKPGEPPALNIEDGTTVTVNLTIGPVIERVAEDGSKTWITPEEAFADIERQVRQGDCKGALPRVDAVVATGQDSAVIRYLVGYCLTSMERYEEALASLQKARELDPSLQGLALLRGQILNKLGRAGEAETELKQQIASTPDSPANKTVLSDAWMALAEIYKQQGRDAEAEQGFRKVTELTPENADAWVELSILYTKMNQPDRAAAVIEESRKVPGAADPRVLLNVGISYWNRKDFEKAAQSFERVIELAPPADLAAMANGLLGKCRLQAGKFDEAKALFRKSLELNPDGQEAQEYRDFLAELEKPR